MKPLEKLIKKYLKIFEKHRIYKLKYLAKTSGKIQNVLDTNVE